MLLSAYFLFSAHWWIGTPLCSVTPYVPLVTPKMSSNFLSYYFYFFFFLLNIRLKFHRMFMMDNMGFLLNNLLLEKCTFRNYHEIANNLHLKYTQNLINYIFCITSSNLLVSQFSTADIFLLVPGVLLATPSVEWWNYCIPMWNWLRPLLIPSHNLWAVVDTCDSVGASLGDVTMRVFPQAAVGAPLSPGATYYIVTSRHSAITDTESIVCQGSDRILRWLQCCS